MTQNRMLYTNTVFVFKVEFIPAEGLAKDKCFITVKDGPEMFTIAVKIAKETKVLPGYQIVKVELLGPVYGSAVNNVLESAEVESPARPSMTELPIQPR